MECEAGWCKTSTQSGIFIVTPSLEGWPTKATEASSPHEIRLSLLDTNPVFHCLGEKYPFTYSFKYPSMDPFAYPFICPFTYPLMYSFKYPFTYSFKYPDIKYAFTFLESFGISSILTLSINVRLKGTRAFCILNGNRLSERVLLIKSCIEQNILLCVILSWKVAQICSFKLLLLFNAFF